MYSLLVQFGELVLQACKATFTDKVETHNGGELNIRVHFFPHRPRPQKPQRLHSLPVLLGGEFDLHAVKSRYHVLHAVRRPWIAAPVGVAINGFLAGRELTVDLKIVLFAVDDCVHCAGYWSAHGRIMAKKYNLSTGIVYESILFIEPTADDVASGQRDPREP